ncbi:hypothetical protein SNOG_13680 [Parastagonospora nodorum SN15]|uniref:Uncharacterized protein n=1 Tax=Phaeosphaeria nodorum (strain SN15 / ATCC MYA-4574 / FGSC 10173) TaxID=321614 RepID=Q0U3I4_PHANO|nr:hypothetical protein SNOG_13680 [Parastagonospora nodorum SN15]EAT79127.1 hypothetical protein SNOG_13680 [Parastagonospora nodorum SN15]
MASILVPPQSWGKAEVATNANDAGEDEEEEEEEDRFDLRCITW